MGGLSKSLENHHFAKVDRNRQRKEVTNCQKATDKTAEVKSYVLTITADTDGMRSPLERQRVAGWVEKQDAATCCVRKAHFRSDTGSK